MSRVSVLNYEGTDFKDLANNYNITICTICYGANKPWTRCAQVLFEFKFPLRPSMWCMQRSN